MKGVPSPGRVRWLSSVIVLTMLVAPGLGLLPSGTITAGNPLVAGVISDGRPVHPVAFDDPVQSVGLPGGDPAGEPFVSAPNLALSELPRLEGARAPPWSAPGSREVPPDDPARLSVRVTASNGTISGRVVDQQTLRAIVGASVVLGLPAGGCPNSFCPTNITGSLGGFAIVAPGGNYTMMVSADNYTDNATPVQVRAGILLSVGTVFLVEDSFVLGKLVGSDPTHEPVPNMTVSGTSRNGALAGSVSDSGPNGSFSVEVPPGADEIDFTSPGAPYLSNFTFADPAPGRTVNLGVIYIVRATEIHLKVIDRVTGLPIGSQFPSSTIVCEAQTSVCPLPAVVSNGSSLTVYAVPGPTQVHEVVLGYVVNVTMIGTIPQEPAGVAVTRQIDVTPLGVLRFTPGATGGLPTVGGNATPASEWWYGVSPNSNISGLDLCSLDGVQVGVVAPPPEYYAPSPCWPGIITHVGGALLALGPPLRDWMELGSFEGTAPMFENETWVNLTPDRLTQVGYLNFTPGAYVSGQVFITGTTHSPNPFVVQACSTDESGICGPTSGFPYPGPPGSVDIDAANATRVGCPTSASYFCVAAPPGPDQLFVRAGSNLTTNLTWLEVPERCCVANPHALALASVTTDHVRLGQLDPDGGDRHGKGHRGPGNVRARARPRDDRDLSGRQ